MAKKRKKDESLALVELIVKGMQEKKAQDIVYFDLRDLPNAVSDFFVVCHGNSNTQVDAIADSVEEIVRVATHEKPWHSEGFENSHWILLDYVNVVVHIFQKEYRDFYRIEDLWADAKIENVESVY